MEAKEGPIWEEFLRLAKEDGIKCQGTVMEAWKWFNYGRNFHTTIAQTLKAISNAQEG